MRTIDVYEQFIESHAHEEGLVLGLGLAGEAGEVCDLLKKNARKYKNVPLDRGRLQEELGDLLWYLTALSQKHGLLLEDLMKANMVKLEERYANI